MSRMERQTLQRPKGSGSKGRIDGKVEQQDSGSKIQKKVEKTKSAEKELTGSHMPRNMLRPRKRSMTNWTLVVSSHLCCVPLTVKSDDEVD
jgi:hypothetical protein